MTIGWRLWVYLAPVVQGLSPGLLTVGPADLVVACAGMSVCAGDGETPR